MIDLDDMKACYADAVDSLVDDGVLVEVYITSFFVENDSLSNGVRDTEHGAMVVEASCFKEAVGHVYLELIEKYPPFDGWKPPSITMCPHPVAMAPSPDSYVTRLAESLSDESVLDEEEELDPAEELVKNCEEALKSLPPEVERMHNEGNPNHSEV